MEYKIRKAVIEDLEKIQELNTKLCVKEFEEFDDTINPNYPMTQKGKDYFKYRIENSEESFSYVATDNDKIIGYFIGGGSGVGDYRTPTKNGEGGNAFFEKKNKGKRICTQV